MVMLLALERSHVNGERLRVEQDFDSFTSDSGNRKANPSWTDQMPLGQVYARRWYAGALLVAPFTSPGLCLVALT